MNRARGLQCREMAALGGEGGKGGTRSVVLEKVLRLGFKNGTVPGLPWELTRHDGVNACMLWQDGGKVQDVNCVCVQDVM